MAKPKVFATGQNPAAGNAILPVLKAIDLEGRIDVVTLGYGATEKSLAGKAPNFRKLSDYGVSALSPEHMESILRKEGANFVLMGTSTQNRDFPLTVEQATVLAARTFNIPTVSVLDFWANYSEKFSDLDSTGVIVPGRERVYVPTRVAVMDGYARGDMITEGFKPETIVVTGNPSTDDLPMLRANFSAEDRARVRAARQISNDAYVFVFPSQPIELDSGRRLGYTEKDTFREILTPLKSIAPKAKQEVVVWVKVHPREKKEDLEAIASEFNGISNLRLLVDPDVVDPKSPVNAEILASDACVGAFSLSMIQAIYLGKPVVSIQPGLAVKDMMPTNRFGITPYAYKSGEAGEFLVRLMTDAKYPTELVEKTKGFTVDGKATSRVKRLVDDFFGF